MSTETTLIYLGITLAFVLIVLGVSSVQSSESKRPRARNFKNWKKASVLQITDLPERHFKEKINETPTINHSSCQASLQNSKISKQIQKFCYDQLFFLKI